MRVSMIHTYDDGSLLIRCGSSAFADAPKSKELELDLAVTCCNGSTPYILQAVWSSSFISNRSGIVVTAPASSFMSDYRRNASAVADESPSVMTNSLASTLSTNFFGGGGVSRREQLAAANEESSQRSKAAIISKATATAISAARSIILTGGSHATAISTARAAAYSVLSPSYERKPGFLTRRKNKQQAQVIANMAVVTVASTIETPKPNDYALADPTVVFMEQQNRSLSKGNTTASTTDDLSWQKNFTRTESHPEAAGTNISSPQDVIQEQDDEEELGDASFIMCETPTSCNMSHDTSTTPFGYFRNKETRFENAPQMGRKMQLDIIESQDKSCESDDGSSYSEENSTLCESGSDGADTQDFTTATTDYTDEDDRADEGGDDGRGRDEADDDTDSDSDDDEEEEDDEDDEDVVSPGHRAVVPAQLQTTNLFDDQILATLTDLCTPSNADAISPPSSQRRAAARSFGFEARDDVDATDAPDTSDGNGSSILGSFFLTNELRDDTSLDAGHLPTGVKPQNNMDASSKQDSGIEQVVLRALASSILPRAENDGKLDPVDPSLQTMVSRSQPSSPSRFPKNLQCALPGTFIRNDPQSTQHDAANSRRSPRNIRRNDFSRSGEPSPATTTKKSNTTTTAWFRWKNRHGRKAAF